jgi:hypothetical protein
MNFKNLSLGLALTGWEHLTYAMSVNTYNNKRKQEK